MRRNVQCLLLTLCLCGLWIVGCDRASEPSTRTQERSIAEFETPERAGWVAEPERSAVAQKCLDLVAAQEFAEAVEICGLALDEGANAEVEAALADARTVVDS